MNLGEPSNEDVRRELQLVLSSPAFARNERQSQFLRFLVERRLDGRDQELKESVLGVEVFGRKPDFDPKIDGIVRTEAIRLRARLEKYYAGEGREDQILIDLPKGGYKPVFRERIIPPPEVHLPIGTQTEPLPSIATDTPVRRPIGRTALFAALVLLLLPIVVAITAWSWRLRAPDADLRVAVLPLENLPANPEDDYLADGLTDELIRNLSTVHGLTVRSQTSSFALKGKRLTAAEKGVQLSADYLVEGSVLHTSDQLRVNVELVRVRDDVTVWSDRYDRKLTDVFAIQDEISQGIVNALRLKLGRGRRHYETNLEAYDLYLRGRHAMASFPGPAGGRRPGLEAVQYYQKAIDEDPNFAIAYAGMADAYLAMAENVAAPEAFARGKAVAERAVGLDPLLSEAHSALAVVKATEFNWQDAEGEFRHAIELDPNNALAHVQLGASVLLPQGRVEEGLVELRRGTDLDPLAPYTNTELGNALLLARRYPEAASQLQVAIALDRSRARPYHLLGRALYLQGKAEEALALFDDIERRGLPSGGWRTCAEKVAGREITRGIPDMKAPQQPSGTPRIDTEVSRQRRLAEFYACTHDEERALEHLENAVASHAPGLVDLTQSPELDWLRPNPRFASIRQRLNLKP